MVDDLLDTIVRVFRGPRVQRGRRSRAAEIEVLGLRAVERRKRLRKTRINRKALLQPQGVCNRELHRLRPAKLRDQRVVRGVEGIDRLALRPKAVQDRRARGTFGSICRHR